MTFTLSYFKTFVLTDWLTWTLAVPFKRTQNLRVVRPNAAHIQQHKTIHTHTQPQPTTDIPESSQISEKFWFTGLTEINCLSTAGTQISLSSKHTCRRSGSYKQNQKPLCICIYIFILLFINICLHVKSWTTTPILAKGDNNDSTIMKTIWLVFQYSMSFISDKSY